MRRLIGLAGFSVFTLSLVLAWGGTAQAQFLLTGNSAAELQIGTGLPLPVGTAGIFLGGMTPMNGGTSCGMGPGGCTISPDGPGTPFWPPLLIPRNANIATTGAPGSPGRGEPGSLATMTIMPALTTSAGGAIVIPPSAFIRPAAGVPVPIAVFPTNPAVFQVATTIDFAWPAPPATFTIMSSMGGSPMVTVPGSVTFAPGGAPGPGTAMGPAGGIITYSGGTKAFGGAGLFAISAGPGAGAVPPNRVPTNLAGMDPVASVWINFKGGLPTTVMTIGIVGASAPNGIGAPGGSLAAPGGTTMFGPVLNGAMTMPNGIGVVNVPLGGTACTMFCMGPNGTVNGSLQPGGAFPSNMVTGSKGFPWTTGLITVSQPGAAPPEIFFLSGTDMRVAGVGNVSLVSGSLSDRALSGPNANRAWLRLAMPEPTVAAGAGAALAMLALCHGLVRRRSS